MMTDERLRDVYQRAVDARRDRARAACVSAEDLLDLVRRDGPERRRLATLDHAMACPQCRDEFELLRSIERAGGEGIAQAVDHLRWRRYASIAAAASVVLAIAIGPGRQLLDRDGEALRGADDDRIEAIAPAAGATVGRGATTFTWRAVPGIRVYLLELLHSNGDIVIARETVDTTITVTLDPALAPGEYRWWVRTPESNGGERRSDARGIRINP